MKFFKEKFQKLSRVDNKGLSLVELICSIAILSLIGATVCGVMVVSADSYNRGNAETKVQQEAQLVANQIDDLLIDATADVSFSGETLKIVQGTTEYRVTRGDSIYGSDALVYQEFMAGADTAISDKQLMASGVTKFDVDVTDFEKLGYIKLAMEFNRKSQNYEATFTITARNKDTTAATEIMAAIYLPNEIILEPNQSWTFHPTTSGLTNTTLHWETSGDTDSSMSGATVTVGANEASGGFIVRAYSEETAANGAPKAQAYVHVYVRKVTGITIEQTNVSGAAYAAGTTYTLKASVQGTHLPATPGADYDADYYDADLVAVGYPYSLTWQVVNGDVEISQNPADSSILYVTLKSDLEMGSSVTVRAVALHPEGTVSGTRYNKTGSPYFPRVEQPWTLQRTGNYWGPSGGWMRRSDSVSIPLNGAFHQLAQSVAGNGATQKVVMRIREYPGGSYSDWINNVKGDGNDSETVNLRPAFLNIMEYNKQYEIQIKMILLDRDGNEVWPTADTPEEEWLVGHSVVDKVSLGFKGGMLLGTDPTDRLTQANAVTIHANQHQEVTLMELVDATGIEKDKIMNEANYILEKRQADGSWASAGTNIQSGPACKVTFRNDNFAGQYRVKVYLKNQPVHRLDANDQPVETGRIDYVFYDESYDDSDESERCGIFYFNVG